VPTPRIGSSTRRSSPASQVNLRWTAELDCAGGPLSYHCCSSFRCSLFDRSRCSSCCCCCCCLSLLRRSESTHVPYQNQTDPSHSFHEYIPATRHTAGQCNNHNTDNTTTIATRMRKRTITTSASVLLLFIASVVSAKHNHIHEHLEALHKRHRESRELGARTIAEPGRNGVEIRALLEAEAALSNSTLEKRQGQCLFPMNAGLVPVTPNAQNAGWAMSPNQPCLPGHYCPYACPPGQVMMQWDPSATSYTYPQSMVSQYPVEDRKLD
jgi:hypothetical protein